MNMMMDKLKLVLSSDENYRIPLMITILSALENKRPDTAYSFVVCVPEDFSLKSRHEVEGLLDDYPECDVQFIDMGHSYKDVELHINHVTVPTYYRLELPWIIEDEKCLYLDVDLVIDKDLSELYNTSIDDYYIAGVKAAGFYKSEEDMESKAKELGIGKLDQYVNAGVLLMNLRKMREENIREAFNKGLLKNYKVQDQDILNSVCYGHIKLLHPKYNSMTKYRIFDVEYYEDENGEYIRRCFTRDEWYEACINPVIIHYADHIKPWYSFGVAYADSWWRYAYILDKRYPCMDELFCRATKWETKYVCGLQDRLDVEIYKSKTAQIKLRKAYDDKSEINAKLQKTYAEKSEINKKLQMTYAEKSDLNSKLQSAYKEMAQRGEELKRIKGSYSYRIGRMITWPVRKLNSKKRNAPPGKRRNRLLIFDVSIDTDNLGDGILMHYGNKIIHEMLKGIDCDVVRIPTHKIPSNDDLKVISEADSRVVVGTNLLCNDVAKYNLWKLPEDVSAYQDTVGMALGMNKYGDISKASVDLYKKIFSVKEVPLSVRDSYTERKLIDAGIQNVINTGCISMWDFTDEKISRISKFKSDNVVFTLTAHRRDHTNDLLLIKMLRKNYEKIYFWPQGDKDLDYLKSMTTCDNNGIFILERTLDSFTNILHKGNIDYVGTRLHGGIYALDNSIRTFIIKVDNRAAEISADSGLPVFDRDMTSNGLEKAINSEYMIDIKVNRENVSAWKTKFQTYIRNHV